MEGVCNDAVADGDVFDVFADGGDCAGCFVAWSGESESMEDFCTKTNPVLKATVINVNCVRPCTLRIILLLLGIRPCGSANPRLDISPIIGITA